MLNWRLLFLKDITQTLAMEEDRTETTVTTRVIRPFKIIAIILAIIGAILLIVAIASSVWIRATGFYQGLWKECFNGSRVLTTPAPGMPVPSGGPIRCYKAMSTGKAIIQLFQVSLYATFFCLLLFA